MRSSLNQTPGINMPNRFDSTTEVPQTQNIQQVEHYEDVGDGLSQLQLV
jgi:hypothetical protein